MPELPEVETVCRGLAQRLLSQRFVAVEQNRSDLRTPMPKNLSAQLQGRVVRAISRRAKYIQIFLDNDTVLLLHLGMSGRLKVTTQAEAAEKHDHLVFHFKNQICVRFNDPRRFGGCDLVKLEDLAQHRWFKSLGIEPLDESFTSAWLCQKFTGKKTSVKVALMDQHLVVGIGNIYATEALFHAGIDPQRLTGDCTPQQIEKLIPAIKKVLRAAIAAGGSSLRDYRQVNGELGYFQKKFAAYGREGEACPGCTCNRKKTGGIQRITQGGRSTFFCATKQK